MANSHPNGPEPKSRRDYSAPALERGFDILELLAAVSGGMTITEIAQGLSRSISEVFRVIVVMERRGWLNKDAQGDRYRISYRMLDVAYRGTPAQSLANVAAPVMAELAGTTNQSCHLVIRAETRGLVIHRQEHAGPASFAMRVGAIIDLVTSCSGHVLLAFETEPRLAGVIAAMPETSRAAAAGLTARLAMVRDRGFEMQPSARTAGVTDISVPVFGFGGGIAAALTVPYLIMIDGSQTTDLNETRALLVTAGERISGYFAASVTADRPGSSERQPSAKA